MASCLPADECRHAQKKIPLLRIAAMSALLLWLLILAVGIYLLIAMLRPDKF